MHVFYVPVLGEDIITLSEEESKHAIRVLRLKKGELVHLADGKGTQCISSIADDNVKKCTLQIKERINHKPRATHLHVTIAPTKNFDRIEWFIEKATELGIEEISFMECTRGERSKVNLDRCIKTAVSAMKQANNGGYPK
jgi:16S rRNA (uracil1498-N3)-methyltransferase